LERFLAWGAAIAASAAMLVACPPSSTPPEQVCTPGRSEACVGAGGCAGGQRCNADGSGFEDCLCASPDAGAAPDAGPGDAGPSDDAGVEDAGPSYQLWLDGDRGITVAGDTVTRWADQTPNNNDVTQDPDNTAAPMPTRVPDAQNGHTAVHFASATNPYLVTPRGESLDFGEGDFLVELVFRHATAPDRTAYFYGQEEAFGAKVRIGVNSNIYGAPAGDLFADVISNTASGGVQSPAGDYNDGITHVVGLRRAANTITLRIDGVEVASSVQSGIVTPSPCRAEVGSFGAAPDGDLFEVVVRNGSIGDSDVAALEASLKTKYAIP
jgi:hypothetical protein